MEIQPDESKDKREHVIDVVRLVVFHVVGLRVLRAKTPLVYEFYACEPVAFVWGAHTLEVVLTS